MANARKCDRCGICFDQFHQEDGKQMVKFRNPIIQTSEDIRRNRFTGMLIPDSSEDAFIDLCPKCTEDFLLFMEGSPLVVRTDICEENAEWLNSISDKTAKMVKDCYGHMWKDT